MTHRSLYLFGIAVLMMTVIGTVQGVAGPVSKITRSLADSKVANDVFELFDSHIATYTDRFAKNASARVYRNKNEAKQTALADALSGKTKKQIAHIETVLRRNPSALNKIPKSDFPKAIDLIGKAAVRDKVNAKKDITSYNAFYVMKAINIFGWKNMKAFGVAEESNLDVIVESGKLVLPGKKFSWSNFRRVLIDADMSGRKYDWAEFVYLMRGKQGRVETVKKGSIEAAQRNQIHGIDFIAIENGRIRVIEFSMGPKPSADNPMQMTEEWVKNNLEKFINGLTEREKKRLIRKGFPEQLLSNPEKLRSSTLSKMGIAREFHAMEKNKKLLSQLDDGIKFVCLESSGKCQ